MRDISIYGARVHNLKNINLSIPRSSLVVFTGVSGSGKTSLAFDTIFAEGQRRYFETLSAYTRQFVADMERPDVDLIEGLSPSISVSQKGMPTSPRSTVGTITEIYDYIRLIYTAIGKPFCPVDGTEIRSTSPERISEVLMETRSGSFVMIMAPLVTGRKGIYRDLIDKIAAKGYSRIRVDGELFHVDDDINMSRYKIHNIELVVDRLEIEESNRDRILHSLQTCSKEGDGAIIIYDTNSNENINFSTRMSCPVCGYGMPKLQPRLFSFNHPTGACSVCEGTGTIEDFDIDLLIPDKGLSIIDGAVQALPISANSYNFKLITAAMGELGIDLSTPVGLLDEISLKMLLYGTGSSRFRIRYKGSGGRWRFASVQYPGIVPILKERLESTTSDKVRENLKEYIKTKKCPECNGARLKKEALSVFIDGFNIGDLSSMPIDELVSRLKSLKLNDKEKQIADGLLNEVLKRLGFLEEVGLSYLTLDRKASTLSGGEYQRVRLAAQIGTYLSGVTYVLDEPTIGLHPRDGGRLLDTLAELKRLGNSVIVIEHDEQTIGRADHVVDIGPGAGRLGGRLIAQGTLKDIKKHKDSLTGQYLSGKLKVHSSVERRQPGDKWLRLKGAKGNNLKNIDLKIPLGTFTCLTGVSGSGKSTLVIDTLYPAVQKALCLKHSDPMPFDKLTGVDNLKRVMQVDTTPIGKTPRSTPATYIGLFDHIRNLYAMLPESRARGYKPGRFSYNVKGGRCEACQGNGTQRIEMHFLPDVYTTCPVCKGLRYNTETLEVTFRGKNIAEVLRMTAEEAFPLFENVPRISQHLKILRDIGLDYLLLGQPAQTLSTGEAQRIKLASELKLTRNNNTLYLLDEPTTGLHFSDVQKLVDTINSLVENGNTVVVIEHNTDVIRCADWIIDLGPEGGAEGGEIVYQGPPDKIAGCRRSFTGKFLK